MPHHAGIVHACAGINARKMQICLANPRGNHLDEDFFLAEGTDRDGAEVPASRGVGAI